LYQSIFPSFWPATHPQPTPFLNAFIIDDRTMLPLQRPLQKATSSLLRCTATRRRPLHLAPPFLLDDYTPRYMNLSSVDAALKRSRAYAHLRNCNLCPRLCGVNRYETTGMCLVGEKAKVNVIAPHFGEGVGRPPY
jgi:hypothetical protein